MESDPNELSYLLLVAPDSVAWSVRDRLDSPYAQLHSAAAPSLSPADPRAAHSRRRRGWQYKLGREWRDGVITVTEQE